MRSSGTIDYTFDSKAEFPENLRLADFIKHSIDTVIDYILKYGFNPITLKLETIESFNKSSYQHSSLVTRLDTRNASENASFYTFDVNRIYFYSAFLGLLNICYPSLIQITQSLYLLIYAFTFQQHLLMQ